MAPEQKRGEQTQQVELSGERKKLRATFHEVGSPLNSLYVKIIADHPEGIGIEHAWQESINALGLTDQPQEQVTAIAGTLENFRTYVKTQMKTIILQEKIGKEPTKLRLNPEYAAYADIVSNLTLASTDAHWVPSEYFLREPRTGKSYEPIRLHFARYLRQELLDEQGVPRTNRTVRMHEIRSATHTKSTSAGRILRELDALGLCNYVSVEKGDPIAQFSLVSVPETIPPTLRHRQITYPEFPHDLIAVIQQLGAKDLYFHDIEPPLNALYQAKYHMPYKRSALYSRVQDYLKELEQQGLVKRGAFVKREGKPITLLNVPTHLEEQNTSQEISFPQLPADIFGFFQARKAGSPPAGYNDITHALYSVYTQNQTEPVNYATLSSAVFTVLENMRQAGYIEKHVERSAITITPRNDGHILLDVAEEYNLLLQNDSQFLKEIETRATEIYHNPDRLRSVCLDAASFTIPNKDHREVTIRTQEEQEQKEKTNSMKLQEGVETLVQPSLPELIDQTHVEALLQAFLDKDGSPETTGALLTYITPVLTQAVSLYEGFGRERKLLYTDVLLAVHEQLELLLAEETGDFHPFTLATAAIRANIQTEIAQGGEVVIPESLRQEVRIAERILGTQNISEKNIVELLTREAQGSTSPIHAEDISRILFALQVKQLAMDAAERNLTRIQLSPESRLALQQEREIVTRERVRQLLAQGYGSSYERIRTLLKEQHHFVPANLETIIAETTQAMQTTTPKKRRKVQAQTSESTHELKKATPKAIDENPQLPATNESESIPESSRELAQLFLEQGGALIVNTKTMAVEILPYSKDPESEYQKKRVTNQSIQKDTIDRDFAIPLRIADAGLEHYVSVLEGSNLLDYYMGPTSDSLVTGVMNNWNRVLFVLAPYITDAQFTLTNVPQETITTLQKKAKEAAWTTIVIERQAKKSTARRAATSASEEVPYKGTLLDDMSELRDIQ